jgi:hypothetical protein
MNNTYKKSYLIWVGNFILGIFNIVIIILTGVNNYPYHTSCTIVAASGWLAAVLAEGWIIINYNSNKLKHNEIS